MLELLKVKNQESNYLKVWLLLYLQALELDAVLACHGRFLEIGRTCVHEDYRRSPAMAVLWSGIADLIRADRYDHLIGCASIDLRDGLALAHATYRQIWARQPAERHRCVRPRLALPPADALADR